LGFVQLGLAVSLSMSKHEQLIRTIGKRLRSRVMRIARRFRCKRFVDNLQIRGRPMFNARGERSLRLRNEKRNPDKAQQPEFFHIESPPSNA
jgi:hypothetical protein